MDIINLFPAKLAFNKYYKKIQITLLGYFHFQINVLVVVKANVLVVGKPSCEAYKSRDSCITRIAYLLS